MSTYTSIIHNDILQDITDSWKKENIVYFDKHISSIDHYIHVKRSVCSCKCEDISDFLNWFELLQDNIRNHPLTLQQMLCIIDNKTNFNYEAQKRLHEMLTTCSADSMKIDNILSFILYIMKYIYDHQEVRENENKLKYCNNRNKNILEIIEEFRIDCRNVFFINETFQITSVFNNKRVLKETFLKRIPLDYVNSRKIDYMDEDIFQIMRYIELDLQKPSIVHEPNVSYCKQIKHSCDDINNNNYNENKVYSESYMKRYDNNSENNNNYYYVNNSVNRNYCNNNNHANNNATNNRSYYINPNNINNNNDHMRNIHLPHVAPCARSNNYLKHNLRLNRSQLADNECRRNKRPYEDKYKLHCNNRTCKRLNNLSLFSNATDSSDNINKEIQNNYYNTNNSNLSNDLTLLSKYNNNAYINAHVSFAKNFYIQAPTTMGTCAVNCDVSNDMNKNHQHNMNVNYQSTTNDELSSCKQCCITWDSLEYHDKCNSSSNNNNDNNNNKNNASWTTSRSLHSYSHFTEHNYNLDMNNCDDSAQQIDLHMHLPSVYDTVQKGNEESAPCNSIETFSDNDSHRTYETNSNYYCESYYAKGENCCSVHRAVNATSANYNNNNNNNNCNVPNSTHCYNTSNSYNAFRQGEYCKQRKHSSNLPYKSDSDEDSSINNDFNNKNDKNKKQESSMFVLDEKRNTDFYIEFIDNTVNVEAFIHENTMCNEIIQDIIDNIIGECTLFKEEYLNELREILICNQNLIEPDEKGHVHPPLVQTSLFLCDVLQNKARKEYNKYRTFNMNNMQQHDSHENVEACMKRGMMYEWNRSYEPSYLLPIHIKTTHDNKYSIFVDLYYLDYPGQFIVEPLYSYLRTSPVFRKKYLSFIVLKDPSQYMGFTQEVTDNIGFFLNNGKIYSLTLLPSNFLYKFYCLDKAMSRLLSNEMNNDEYICSNGNIILSSTTEEHHLKLINTVMKLLTKYRIGLNYKESVFFNINGLSQDKNYCIILQKQPNFNAFNPPHLCSAYLKSFFNNPHFDYTSGSGLGIFNRFMLIYMLKLRETTETHIPQNLHISLYQYRALYVLHMTRIAVKYNIPQNSQLILWCYREKYFIIGSLGYIEYIGTHKKKNFVHHAFLPLFSYKFKNMKTEEIILCQVKNLIQQKFSFEFNNAFMHNEKIHIIVENFFCDSCMCYKDTHQNLQCEIVTNMETIQEKVSDKFISMIQKFHLCSNNFIGNSCFNRAIKSKFFTP